MAASASGQVRRVAMLSVHTSPLVQPGSGDGGGLNVTVLEVCRRLAARGVSVDVFTRSTAPSDPPTVVVEPGLAVHHVVAGPRAPIAKEELPSHLCAFVLGLLRHPAVRRWDVMHAHYWMSGWVGRRLARRLGIPLVQTFHTLARVKNDALAPGDVREPPLRLAAEARVVADADQIVVSTCDEGRLLHHSYGTSGARITVVPPGVDLELFRPGSAPVPAEAPAGDGPLLLFVGRLQPLKGPDVAIRTLAEVREVVPGTRLLLVGGPSGASGAGASDALRALARELGVGDAVRLVSARPHRSLPDLYRAADVVLVPSRSESFGLVALEAQACGTPVVAADVVGLRSVVRCGGTLVAGHEPGDHAAAVVAYLNDPAKRRRAAIAGRSTACEFSWDRTADALLGVYERMSEQRVAVSDIAG